MKEIANFTKEDLLNIFNTLDDGILVFDKENKLFLINEKAKKYLDIEEEKILGKNFENFSYYPNSKLLFYLLGEEIREVSKKEIEFSKELILNVTVLPSMEQNKKVGKIVILHDITREKRVERLKTDFVSISAHQLRTPLASLKWSLEILSRTKIDEFQKKTIERAKEAVNRMLVLVNELLEIVKIEEGKYLLKFETSNFEEIVKKAIDMFQEKIKEKQIQFQLKILSKKIPKISIDPQKILIVIENLIENAINYSPKGSMITISLSSNEKEISFSIEDNGIGIPREEQKNIFQRFFRGSNAIKADPDGSGFGLFVSKNIIEAHRGKIWFESKEGQGTTFYFTLPLK